MKHTTAVLPPKNQSKCASSWELGINETADLLQCLAYIAEPDAFFRPDCEEVKVLSRMIQRQLIRQCSDDVLDKILPEK